MGHPRSAFSHSRTSEHVAGPCEVLCYPGSYLLPTIASPITIISIATLTTVVCLQVNVIVAISVTYLLFFCGSFNFSAACDHNLCASN